MSWKKGDIQNWMRSKNICFEPRAVKQQLMAKINPIKNNYQAYVVDEMAKEKGVTVLRLPPYHCELNPIELIWADIKGYVARNNTTFKFGDVKRLLNEGMAQVTKDKWTNCVEHVKKVEEKMRGLDSNIDKTVDRFIIQVSESESSVSGSETDASL